jgi:hypothetical protein
MNYSNRTYATVLLSDIDKVDFSQVMETSPNTIRKSVDQTQFVLKWYTENEPTFITDKSVTLTWSGSHSDCLQLMSTIEWTPEIEG